MAAMPWHPLSTTMWKFVRENMLAIAMLLGIAGFRIFTVMTSLVPYMILVMLFFTFLKVNPIDLRLHRWHWLVLIFQLITSVLIFYALLPIDRVLAQGLMVCLLMPTATAAAIITGKLGGSIQSLTSFTLLSNIATALIVPVWFPWVNPEVQMTFMARCWQILQHVGPMLIGPFVAAWLVRLIYDQAQRMQHSQKRFCLSHGWAEIPFYVWACSLVILMAQTTEHLVDGTYNWSSVIWLFAGALITCIMQFKVGKLIGQQWPSLAHGQDYQDIPIHQSATSLSSEQITRISAGQALGQKNTTLGIWLAQAYLDPISSLGPAAYIVWQNAFNSWQLHQAANGKLV